MIFATDKYKKGNYSMPNREDRSIDKDSDEYNLKVAQYMYHLFCKGSTFVSHDSYSSIRRNREYALGMQNEDIYRDVFYGKEGNSNTLRDISDMANSHSARRKAYANLNFSIQSPMPRVMDSIVNKLTELVNRVSVDATDQYSGGERENAKWGAYVDGKYREQLDLLKTLNAIPTDEKSYSPKNLEELNLYEAEGGFKLAYEETMERLLKYVFEQSMWEENIVENLLRDLTTLGFAVVEDVYDKYSGQVKLNYIDAEYAGVQYTKKDSNHNPDYGFFVEMVKMSELAKKGIKPKKINELASIYSNNFGNPSIGDWNKTNKKESNIYNSAMDSWVVPVFVVKWKDVEHTIEKEYRSTYGKTRTKKVDGKYKFKKSEKEINTRVRMIRETHWVISSDIVYDYGLSEFQGRDGKNEPVLPIHMVQVSNRPIVPRLIPSLDQYMNGWMKLQQGLSMAAMNGYAINMDAVSNLKMGDEKMHPREVLRLWRQTGTLFFKPTDVAGRPNMSQVRPIEQLTGGAGAVIAESMQVMDVAMKQIEDLTGINPVSMGANPSPDQGKAVTEFAIIGTNDILKGVLRPANILKSNAARAACLRLSHVVHADKRAYGLYKNIVGETSLETLKIAQGHDVTYGIRTHARPTQQEVAAIDEMLMLSLKNGRDGKVGITEADYIRFKSMMASGASLKRIALLLDFANQKAEEEAEAKASRLQQENIQGTQQLEQQKAQQAQQELMMKTQAEISVKNIEGRNALLKEAVANNEMTAMQALAMLGIEQPPQAQPQQQQQPQNNTTQPRNIPIAEDAV